MSTPDLASWVAARGGFVVFGEAGQPVEVWLPSPTEQDGKTTG